MSKKDAGFVAVRLPRYGCAMYADPKLMNEMLCRVFKRLHYLIEVILVRVRWYVAYPLSLQHLEEMMAQLGVAVDHSTIHRWAFMLRRSKYLHNIVEQDHRAIKRVTRPMLGFKTFRYARTIIAGIETMHMIRKGQPGDIKDETLSAADQFYSLAF